MLKKRKHKESKGGKHDKDGDVQEEDTDAKKKKRMSLYGL